MRLLVLKFFSRANDSQAPTNNNQQTNTCDHHHWLTLYRLWPGQGARSQGTGYDVLMRSDSESTGGHIHTCRWSGNRWPVSIRGVSGSLNVPFASRVCESASVSAGESASVSAGESTSRLHGVRAFPGHLESNFRLP